MSIVDVRDTVVPIRSRIRNAYIDFEAMTVSVVAVITDAVRDGRPVVGFGFNSNGRYNAQGLLRDRFVPRLLRAAREHPATLLDPSGANLDPQAIWPILMRNEKPGGHGERSVAVGVLDMALWDATAKIAGVPLWRLLADRFNGGAADSQVFVYAAGGYYHPDKGDAGLREEMRSYLERGYSVVKMKIGGAGLDEDLRRIETVVDDVLDGAADRLAVDANGRFDLGTALAYGEALGPLGVRWYEEPADPLDFKLHSVLSERYPGPLATGENLFSHLDARNLIRHGGMRGDRDILQFDPALSYGLTEYLRTLDMLDQHGWSRRRCIPHGGHQFALNIAAGLGLGGNESYPDVFEPFNGFADHIPVESSLVKLPDEPGLALETKSELYRSVLKPLAQL
ncbi:mandelate racemase/muconate lactonizing enzyme family protein [Nonomuraea typhae]|uniref:Mandelate racemase/muconate lactonizing enzyme family protein n=1 Tax=Nonomuraea typhae TaxID=2603600 RepID=A0ABW7Z8K2_9ACTN